MFLHAYGSHCTVKLSLKRKTAFSLPNMCPGSSHMCQILRAGSFSAVKTPSRNQIRNHHILSQSNYHNLSRGTPMNTYTTLLIPPNIMKLNKHTYTIQQNSRYCYSVTLPTLADQPATEIMKF